jgi:hypothetical protein
VVLVIIAGGDTISTKEFSFRDKRWVVVAAVAKSRPIQSFQIFVEEQYNDWG